MIPDRDDGPTRVLLVEDNPGDIRLVREAIDGSRIEYELDVVRDGEAALDYLTRRGEGEPSTRPHLVLLDLNLPKVDGIDVLERIKSDDELDDIPVVVLTSSAAEEDVVRSYDLHTNAYLMKPIDPDEFLDLVRSIEEFWLGLVRLPPAGR